MVPKVFMLVFKLNCWCCWDCTSEWPTQTAARIVKQLFIHNVNQSFKCFITLITEADVMLWWIKQFLWIKPALVLTHSAIKHLLSFCRVHPAYGCRHQQIPRYRAEERGPVPRDGTQQQDWSHRALVCCLAGISIVYWQQSTLLHSPSYHRFIIQRHTSVCNRSSKENQHISLPLAKTSQKIYQYHER